MSEKIWNQELKRYVDRATGPISREEFAALVSAPYGAAKKAIRKYDPLFGLKEGEKIKWLVTFVRETIEKGEATVEAASRDEAEKLAANLDDKKITWGTDYDFKWDSSGDIESVEPIT